MQLVNEKYYYWYNRLLTFSSLIFLVGVIAANIFSHISFVSEVRVTLGLSFVTGILSALQFLYGLFFFKRYAVLKGAWFACLVSTMIVTLGVISLVHNTGGFHSWYLIAWASIILATGIFGQYPLIAAVFIVLLYSILTTTGNVESRQAFDKFSIGVLVGSFLISLASYFICRTQYIDQESQQVSKLTGQLRSNQQQAEILIQSIADGIIVTNTQGNITLINPSASVMTQWKIEEATGIDVRLVTKLMTEDGKELTKEQDPFSTVLSQKEHLSKVFNLVGRDGKNQIISLVISPVLLPETSEFAGTVAVLRDISKEREEEKQRADFISTASHEMRTPVAAIEGYLALALNEQVSKIDDKAREYLEKAHASTQHLGQLFQDLLTSAKAEDGRMVSHPVIVEMGTFIEQLVDTLRFAAEKKGLFTQFVIGTGTMKSETTTGSSKIIKPLYYIHADPERIREVITNIFDNAVKYTETGKITIGLTGDRDIVQIYVKDTGSGIPEEDIEHLFQKFYRVDNSTTRTIGGTGLGLFICRKIIELYRGRIWVESKAGSGSTFFINLPRIDSQTAEQLQGGETVNIPAPTIT
ncbi:PAS domain-containing protein [Candidatus Saccharibacteria bacterium]|nr:PAS domain-containing protein [Candidatus Saccharibacteria bacterium]MBI3338307.1 PAS domain-containing protein [Candidatus Saccharibacteria bacterium]